MRERGRPLSEDTPQALNIGWLDRSYIFSQGTVEPELMTKLWLFCRSPVNETLGFHECPFCQENSESYLVVEQNGEKIGLGSAEIWVFGREGKAYAAPTLIYHYIVQHHYRPPDEFLKALSEGPLPNTPEYDMWAGRYMWGQIMLRKKNLNSKHTNASTHE